MRKEGKIALATASSGIAALLLDGGRTAHSRFKIPVGDSLNQNSSCYIPKEGQVSRLLCQASLIIWDEAVMTHRWAFEALDRSLRDITGFDVIFGGKVILFSGDFRQILPVVARGGRPEIVNACLNQSYIWPHLKNFT